MSVKKTLTKSRSRQLFGVAGGIAQYLNIDPTIVRIGFVLAIFTPLPSIIAYIILALVMPEPTGADDAIDVTPPPSPAGSGSSGSTAPGKRPFARSTSDKWIAGVCGGIGRYFDIDPVIVRALFLVALLGFGTGLLAYLILAIVMPRDTQVA